MSAKLVKKIIHQIFRSSGYRLTKSNSCIDMFRSEYLKSLGYHPSTIIDVGVGKGTFELYNAFPKSQLILIDPLIEYKTCIDRILTKYQGKYFQVAVGEKIGSLVINVEPSALEKSSFLERTPLTKSGKGTIQREIDMVTLDYLFEEYSFDTPMGLKIDVEGYEREVIEGAKKLLQETIFVIAEVSIMRRFEQHYSFGDFVNLMENNGFLFHKALQVNKWYADILFKKG